MLKVAIIGSGTAGASAALFLQKDNFQITVFERESIPKPVGAGIMLQPTGYHILKKLVSEKEITDLGTPLTGLNGYNHIGETTLEIPFQNNQLKGLGIHRGALFFLLYNKLRENSIPVINGIEIIDFIEKNNKTTLLDTKGNQYGAFDLVIIANGASSILRKKTSLAKKDTTQKFGALWAKIPYDNSVFNNKIHQYYSGCKKMLGFMPIGKLKGNQQEYVNFFWSASLSEVNNWENKNFEEWKSEVFKLCPPKLFPLIDILKKDDIMATPYRDAKVSPCYKGNIILIGDAAHPMSPQLSQGASFALLDTFLLSESLKTSPSIDIAFKQFHKNRYKQVYFYQSVSKIVTPLFQSNSDLGYLRDYFLKKALAIPFIKTLVSDLVLGYRESLFKRIPENLYRDK